MRHELTEQMRQHSQEIVTTALRAMAILVEQVLRVATGVIAESLEEAILQCIGDVVNGIHAH